MNAQIKSIIIPYLDVMEEFMKKVADKFDCEIEISENNYDLGFMIRNLPSTHMILKKKTDQFNFAVSRNFMFGTSNSPSVWSGNTPDKYTVSCTIHLYKNLFPDFLIMEHGPFQKLIFREHVRIRCKDESLKKKLKSNQLIKKIFRAVRSTAEFSPVIQGKNHSTYFSLDINYQSFEKLEEIFEIIIKFCLDFENQILHKS